VLPTSVQQEIQGSFLSHPSPSSLPRKLFPSSFEQGNAYVVAPVGNGATTYALIIRGYYVRFSRGNLLTFLLFFEVSAVIFLLGAGARAIFPFCP
jgi:hypothetical protein